MTQRGTCSANTTPPARAFTQGHRAEHVWLGDQPVAVIANSGVYYVLSDQLNTPRQLIDSSAQLRWRWDNLDPFGANAPNTNPAGLGGFTYNLRFPGQYADAETGLFYNYYRSYDPKGGGYTQSDPIGLAGGLNTYGYVGGNPLNDIDPLGLAKKNKKLPQPSYFNCDAADLEQCAKKCGSANNVERCAVRITPKIKCITSDGTQLTEDKVETLCECKGDDVDPLENEPNPIINPIKPLLLPRLPAPIPIIP